MKRTLLGALFTVLVLLAGLLLVLHLQFRHAEPYPNLNSAPLLPATALQAAVVSERPIGNAAVSASGRIFYTIHPESQPDYPKLLEWVDGKAVPYPATDQQPALFSAPLGVAIDQQQRLWVIDPANHGLGRATLVAFDLNHDKTVHRYQFSRAVAPLGSFLQDLQISSDGRWIYIADVGFWPMRPALVVYDSETGRAHRALERHPSVMPQDYLIRTKIRDMRFIAGLVNMKTGVDGIALSLDDSWLYYGAMNHDTLYRIPTSALQDATLDQQRLAAQIEEVGRKPLNDGLSIDTRNGVYLTDVENQSVMYLSRSGALSTVIQSPQIRWSDGLSYGPDGWLYLADSAIPHLILSTPAQIRQQAPYYIWRFPAPTAGRPGQ